MTEGRNLNANKEDLRKRILPSHSSILSSFNPRMANKKVQIAEPSAVRALAGLQDVQLPDVQLPDAQLPKLSATKTLSYQDFQLPRLPANKTSS